MIDHDREVFYKYISIDAAKSILKTKTMRWGCPYTFNDPFDTQIEMQTDFINEQKFIEEFTDTVTNLVYSEEEPKFIHYGTLGISAMILMLRKIKDRLPFDQLKKDMKEALEEGAINAIESLKTINEDWHNYIANSRVLCVTEDKDNLLMWAHYTNDHKGLVIELKCLPEYDTALCAAKQIKYIDKIIPFANEKDFINDSLGLSLLDKSKLFEDFAFSKSNHWSYEKEWRCFTISHPSRTDESGSFDTNALLEKEVNAIYLGCRMTEQDKSEILEILSEEHYQHVKIFESTVDKRNFCLNFNQIR